MVWVNHSLPALRHDEQRNPIEYSTDSHQGQDDDEA